MKRYSFLLILLLAVAVIASACAEGGQSTGVPSETEMSDLSSETLETPAVDLTEASATEPALDETPVVTNTVGITGTGDMTTAGTPASVVSVDPGLLSNILDLDVWNRDDEQIGSVEDLIVNLGEQKIDYVVVSVGGFLGLGDRDIPVPWDALEFQSSAPVTGTLNIPEHRFLLDVSKELLEQAPELDPESIPGIGVDSPAWDAEYSAFWASQTSLDASSTSTGTLDMSGAAEITTTTEITGTSDVMVSQLQGVILTSELGSPVIQTSDGQEAGKISDAVVDLDTGEIRYVILFVDLDGMGTEKWVAVPLNAFKLDVAKAALVLVVDRAALQQAPSFERDQFPDTQEDGWDLEIKDYWSGHTGSMLD